MITVVGEALVDLTPASCDGQAGFVPSPGGSPFNVAVGTARLGAATAFVGVLSSDTFGRRLAEHLVAEGVDTSHAISTDAPTTLAVVELDDRGSASYDFYLEGTAAFELRAATPPPATSILHVSCGAVTLAHDPAGTALQGVLAHADGPLTSFDPNVRPAFVADRAAYADLLERAVSRCDLVKVSDEDLDWCYPDEPVEEVAARWLGSGPALVVVTGGPVGAVALGSDSAQVMTPSVEVVDTVGAGDSFTSALLAWLLERGVTDREAVAALDRRALTEALRFAVGAAAVTCSRRGADPPRRGDLRLG